MTDLYYDPFDHAIDDDPYPVWKRMRAEAPLYFNEKYNFYALSRYDDVARALPDWQTYRSGRGTTADILFSGIEVPPGILLFEDPPLHDLHRRLLSRSSPRGGCWRWRIWCASSVSAHWIPFATLTASTSSPTSAPSCRCGTIGYLLGIPEEGPAQRRDRGTGRHEPPSPVQARYVAADVEHYGHTVVEGSYMLLLNGSANRDETKFADPDRYDIHRAGGHLSFGQGLHFCLGSALARLEGRVAFEEVLKRCTDWDVDYAAATMAHTSSVRGWARMPVTVR
jgi:cytochrome P450